MSYIAGLDIGSAVSKAVIMEDGHLKSYSTYATGGNFSVAADKVFNDALAKAQLSSSDISLIGATGMGVRFISQAFTKITEISCHSRGTHYLLPEVRTLVEVGNQASKVIKVTSSGRVADSLVSDKCAAGSGRVLQVVAKVIKVKLEEMGALSLKSARPVKFTTGCAVFLETEAISRVAEGNAKEDIIAGLHNTMSARIGAMVQRMRIEEDCAMTGGGAKDRGLVKKMEEKLGKTLFVPEEPLITGAIGAALIVPEKHPTAEK